MQFGRDFPPVWWCTRWSGGGCAHWVCSGGRRSLTWRAGPATCTLAPDPGSSQSHPAGRGHRRSRWTQRPSPSGPPQTQFVLNGTLLGIELKFFLMQMIKHKRIYLNMGFDMMAREMDEDYGIDISIYGLFSPSPNSALSSHIHNIKIHKKKTTGRDLSFRCKDWIWNQDSVHWKFGFSLLFNLDRVCNWAAAKQDGDQFKADEEFSSQVLSPLGNSVTKILITDI